MKTVIATYKEWAKKNCEKREKVEVWKSKDIFIVKKIDLDNTNYTFTLKK